jgi:alanyl-tRNA synthetase
MSDHKPYGTEPLYYERLEDREFDAAVTAVKPAEGGVYVTLDRTLFYPEGGGQPADSGTLDGIPVLDVQKDADGTIRHLLASAPAGGQVRGVIDWERRRDYMQQHTGQHIVSAAFMRAGGFATVSVHLGEQYVTVELEAESLPNGTIEAVEDIANEAVCMNLPVRALLVPDTEIYRYPLRRPPKVTGLIRLIEIPGYDLVACGGLHVGRTGEVRLVKCIGSEKIRGRVRTIWKIGDRAMRDYREKTAVTDALQAALSAPAQELPERVARLQESLREAGRASALLLSRLGSLTTERLYAEAGPAAGSGAASGLRVIAHAFEEEDPAFMKKTAEELSTRQDAASCIVNVTGESLQWAICLPKHAPLSFAEVKERLLPIIDGTGGGRPPLFRGAGKRPENREAFLAAFKAAFGS